MSGPKSSHKLLSATVGPPLLILALLCYPICLVVLRHLTLTGACEESLGYRYFYTLRLIYDSDRYVFLPQGHLMDLVHQMFQYLLTAIGYPPSEVFPRIDLFSYASILTGHLASVLCFCFAVRSFPRSYIRWILALLVVVPFYSVNLSGFSVILTPDYMLWILPLMLVTCGFVVRAYSSPEGPWKQPDTLVVAVLVTVALGLKVTLLIYPIALTAVLFIKRRGFLDSFTQAATGATLGVVGWLAILVIYYHGRWDYVLRYFSDEAGFGSSVRPDISYFSWLRSEFQGGREFVIASVILPIISAVLLVFSRDRSKVALLSGVLAGSIMYHLFIYFRDTPVTWFEAANFLMLAAIAVLCWFGTARISVAGMVAPAMVGLLAVAQVLIGISYMQQHYLPYLADLKVAQTEANHALERYNDRIAFLLPDNSYRPLTVDSGIFKGGSNILFGPYFGRSSLVRGMFPRRDYYSGTAAHFAAAPLNLSPFEAVVFVIRKGLDPGPQGQLEFMRKRYGASLQNAELVADIDFGSQEFLVWRLKGKKMTDTRTGRPFRGLAMNTVGDL